MDTRNDLREAMLKKSNSSKVVTKSVPFANSDVPDFLRELKEFERASAKINHFVG